MLFKSRQEILADFRAQIAQGKILVGVGAGTGITAVLRTTTTTQQTA